MIIKKVSQKFTEGSLLKLPYLTKAIYLSASHHTLNFLQNKYINCAINFALVILNAKIKAQAQREIICNFKYRE